MSNDPQELTGALGKVNGLGTATERLFSRLYRGLNRRSQIQQDFEKSRQQNRQLKQMVRKRDVEIERLHAILGTINEGVIMQDLDGQIVLVNDAARQLLGTIKNFWDSELGSLFEAYRDVANVEMELTPLGEPTRVQVNNKIVGAQVAAVADSAGARLGTVIVLRDVTRDAISSRIKDEFITAISHELRTPMAVIKGMSEVILGQPADKPAPRRFLETLGRNVDILDRMIVELLDISEMSAGAFGVHQNLLNLEELVWNVVRGYEPEVKQNGLDVAVLVRDNPHLYITGDDQRLRWGLGHILQNAIRYTESGGHIVLMLRLHDAKHVAVQVADSGVGIADKDLPHIFERFYRGEPRTSSGKLLDPRGLGQGLFVARAVAEAHNGYLSVRSAPGEGSIFTFVLPAAEPDPA
jgi:signal transduction histidine kinase